MFGPAQGSPSGTIFGMPDYIKHMNRNPEVPVIQAPQGRGMFGRFATQPMPIGPGQPVSAPQQTYVPNQGSQPVIPAPKDRGFFGRFLGTVMGQPYGAENMGWVERLGRGADGMNAYRDQMRQQQMRDAAAGGDMTALGRLDPFAAARLKRQMERDEIADRRYSDETEYSRGRDELTDERWQAGHDRDLLWRKQDLDRQDRRYSVEDDFTERGLNVQEATAAARIAALQAENNQPELSDVRILRDTFDKKASAFEAAQRNFNSMSKLALDDSGASDVALGFAFFKTIDPTSSVREGEFAQAATGMGLDQRVISYFQNLDRGIKFTPELRQDLLAAAGHAYNEQVVDIQAAYDRNVVLAERFNIDPSLIAYDPVRAAQGSSPVRISNDDDYDKLAPGTRFIDPDGNMRVK